MGQIEQAEALEPASRVEALVETDETVFKLENDHRFQEIALENANLCAEGLETIVHRAAFEAIHLRERRERLFEAQSKEAEALDEQAEWFERISRQEAAPVEAYKLLEEGLRKDMLEAADEARLAATVVTKLEEEKPPPDVLRERLQGFFSSEARLYRLTESLHDLESVTAEASAPDIRRLAIAAGEEAARLEGFAKLAPDRIDESHLRLAQRLSEARLAVDSTNSTPLLGAEQASVDDELRRLREALAEGHPAAKSGPRH